MFECVEIFGVVVFVSQNKGRVPFLKIARGVSVITLSPYFSFCRGWFKGKSICGTFLTCHGIGAVGESRKDLEGLKDVITV